LFEWIENRLVISSIFVWFAGFVVYMLLTVLSMKKSPASSLELPENSEVSAEHDEQDEGLSFRGARSLLRHWSHSVAVRL
jgi:hypothetical protein